MNSQKQTVLTALNDHLHDLQSYKKPGMDPDFENWVAGAIEACEHDISIVNRIL